VEIFPEDVLKCPAIGPKEFYRCFIDETPKTMVDARWPLYRLLYG